MGGIDYANPKNQTLAEALYIGILINNEYLNEILSLCYIIIQYILFKIQKQQKKESM